MTGAPPSAQPDWQAICLCAAWCGVCREWDGVFQALGNAYPQVRFAWVDVEDEADALGDVDVETFPTLLVARGDEVRFFGPVQPSPTQVARLLDNLLEDPHATPRTPAEARALLHRLQDGVLPKR